MSRSGPMKSQELNWTYLSFMSLATVIATAIAIVLDSQILVIGAMVLGPEFGAVAALGVALVRRRYALLGHAAGTLVLGFLAGIAVTTVFALAGRALGWITLDDLVGSACYGLHLQPRQVVVHRRRHRRSGRGPCATSARSGGLAGVFISGDDDSGGRGQHRPRYRLRGRVRNLPSTRNRS